MDGCMDGYSDLLTVILIFESYLTVYTLKPLLIYPNQNLKTD